MQATEQRLSTAQLLRRLKEEALVHKSLSRTDKTWLGGIFFPFRTENTDQLFFQLKISLSFFFPLKDPENLSPNSGTQSITMFQRFLSQAPSEHWIRTDLKDGTM